MQRECDEYYEDSQVFLGDVLKFKDIVKTIDISKYSHSHREYCEEVEKVFKEIFTKNGEVIYDEPGDIKKEKIDQYGDTIKEVNNNDREV
mgnify:FL=1